MKEYFSHDLKARNDRKMVRLMMAHGMTGIGVYWCIVEMLYEEDGRLMRSECERIAFELRVTCDLVESVIADFDLFEFDENDFWSASVDRRIEVRKQVSEGAKKAAQTRWEKLKNQQVNSDNAAAMQSHQKRNANKEKKRKEKESKINNIDIPDVLDSAVFLANVRSAGEFKYPEKLLNDFFNYWSEKNSKGKMRWQLEKTFEIPNRLATWASNENKWSRPNQPVKNSLDAAKGNLQSALNIIYNSES
jgi:hypothetical protein